ncbi:membrane-bound PQQ-dependent dehydrogenase, glucose/quinate/shikimate family [Luteibacter aegosomaticola]|uniref:membrane-bound PQQ-dependent dehydrogenase, glucose/quinate/shikimate family n=1 Tax=Luteibacter aegosomaticola TaxID=2911538 RepID=UPI001FF9FE8D|nr:membrane-bound PQQ-dependent dehydrogenase, glucose/quinate/shikimate family [Luteibacter aegosomaticola]UPG90514.1 membrane-bound PQQ-dependent dehydrogenase, glucose/quinate/shikimate family [Luteibacter aegosomaticola]
MKKLMVGAAVLVGILLSLAGLGLAGGGFYLISLGGSWFYAPAGLALAAAGIGLALRRAWSLWVALALLAVSVIWALAEVGLDFWQVFPRIIVFLIVALLTTIASPILRKKSGGTALPCRVAGVLGALLAIVVVALFGQMFRPHATVVAKDDTPARVLNPDAGKADGNDWSAWGRNTLGEKYVQFTQINKTNVKDLKVAWTYRTGDLAIDGSEYQVTPLKVDDTVYLCTPLNKVIALDATTGKEKWRFDPKPQIFESTKGWKRCRGLGYADLDKLPAPDVANAPAAPVGNAALDAAAPALCRKRIIETTIDARILALDAKTGALCEGFGNKGYVNLEIGLPGDAKGGQQGSYNVTSAPLVADGVIMVGGRLNDNLTVGEPGGTVRGYDVVTGKNLWAWDPKRGATDSSVLPAGETAPIETPNFWGTAAYDPKLGLAYFPTGNQTPDFWTGDRHPYSNEYTDAVVAVDLKTGKERWHFRTANIDQYDYDVSTQPILYDMPQKDGTTLPVLIQGTKRSQIFVLDRRTGKPVYPVENRKVPTDVMPGMQVSDVQPYSALSIGVDRLKESDMWGATIFDQLYCRIAFKKLRYKGEWTPLSDKQDTLIWPGYYGGQNWGSMALDPATGTLYVNDIRMAMVGRFLKREEAAKGGLKPSTEGEYSEQLGTPWGVERGMFLSPLGTPCFKPPFGSLSAVDLATNTVKWQVPLGGIQDAPIHNNFVPKAGIVPHLNIPVGMPNLGGPLVTAGGLNFFHGTLDYYLRAFDNDTGKQVWSARLPVGGQGTPMSYIGSDGKQYIVVVDGGATRTGTNEHRGDYVIAYSLPDAEVK